MDAGTAAGLIAGMDYVAGQARLQNKPAIMDVAVLLAKNALVDSAATAASDLVPRGLRPGQDITSASAAGGSAVRTATQMAAAHAAGVAALYKGNNPNAASDEIAEFLETESTKDVITNLSKASPNMLGAGPIRHRPGNHHPGSSGRAAHRHSSPTSLPRPLARHGDAGAGSGVGGRAHVPRRPGRRGIRRGGVPREMVAASTPAALRRYGVAPFRSPSLRGGRGGGGGGRVARWIVQSVLHPPRHRPSRWSRAPLHLTTSCDAPRRKPHRAPGLRHPGEACGVLSGISR
ncbi:hypothetical protein [Streptomyces sp. NPDC046161]|uniref:hypothetical protein n=1 Tax=Streptomyces sp. NPDC046161 TaxID=3155132 RepID=UPI0033DAF13D